MEPVLADKHPYDKPWTEIGSMQNGRDCRHHPTTTYPSDSSECALTYTTRFRFVSFKPMSSMEMRC